MFLVTGEKVMSILSKIFQIKSFEEHRKRQRMMSNVQVVIRWWDYGWLLLCVPTLWYFLEQLCTVFKSGKHVKIVQSIERYFLRLSNPKENTGNRLTEEEVIGDFLVKVNSPGCERRANNYWEETQRIITRS